MTAAERNATNLSLALEFYGNLAVQEDVKLIRAPVDISVFNIALLEGRIEEAALPKRVDTAATHFHRFGTPWSFWLCEDYVERKLARRLHHRFDEWNMTCVADVPGMELEGMPDRHRNLPQVDVRRARDLPTRREFAELVSMSFQVPIPAAMMLYTREAAWTPDITGWVGYHLGQPIATAISVVDEECIGLYSISTHPQWRRHGFAEALMRVAMERATRETGMTRFVLQSSPSGLKLYRKMGFRRVTRFLVFATT